MNSLWMEFLTAFLGLSVRILKSLVWLSLDGENSMSWPSEKSLLKSWIHWILEFRVVFCHFRILLLVGKHLEFSKFLSQHIPKCLQPKRFVRTTWKSYDGDFWHWHDSCPLRISNAIFYTGILNFSPREELQNSFLILIIPAFQMLDGPRGFGIPCGGICPHLEFQIFVEF